RTRRPAPGRGHLRRGARTLPRSRRRPCCPACRYHRTVLPPGPSLSPRVSTRRRPATSICSCCISSRREVDDGEPADLALPVRRFDVIEIHARGDELVVAVAEVPRQ